MREEWMDAVHSICFYPKRFHFSLFMVAESLKMPKKKNTNSHTHIWEIDSERKKKFLIPIFSQMWSMFNNDNNEMKSIQNV